MAKQRAKYGAGMSDSMWFSCIRQESLVPPNSQPTGAQAASARMEGFFSLCTALAVSWCMCSMCEVLPCVFSSQLIKAAGAALRRGMLRCLDGVWDDCHACVSNRLTRRNRVRGFVGRRILSVV
eukprot:1052322-Amphidinium_carterae.1